MTVSPEDQTQKKDYKSTLNLPETKFPMQAGLAQREPERLKRWEAERLYDKVQQATASRPAYWLVDGPPYANGDIHIGHAVNKVLKDIVVKSARLSGHQAPYIPGWDCHGLPIELQVEKKHGKVGPKEQGMLDAKTFRQKCREYATEQIARQREDFKRLGVLGDWENPYLTMNPAFEAEQLRALAQIVERGHVARGYKPVHWCLDCGSSLAEAEVEYEDKKSPSIDVRFAAVDAADLARRFGAADAGPISLVIWTTTPWTLPANQAIAAHPEFDYVLAQVDGGRLVVAEGLLEGVAKRLGGEARVLGKAKGAALKGVLARHPFAGRDVPVILGEHVTLDTGTGLVHTAPAHGVEDYVVGREYGLPVDNPVGGDGKFFPNTPLVGGLHVRKADEVVLNGLRERGALAHQAEIAHSYPHCWRHKTPLIFRATPQWFISMDAKGLRQDALQGIAATRWIPGWGEARIREMVAGRPDWCISRQRHWGVPLAVFVHKEKGTLHPDMPALMRRIADKVEREGLEAWFGSTAGDWLGAEAAQYDKCTDTLDVWFDSGVVHQCSFATAAKAHLRDGQAPVADMYLEGSDQHRGWFMSSLLTSAAMFGRAPYKAVLTHGFTVDEQGRKMSKSLGNVVAPQQVTKTLGADVLRLWVAASDYSGEIAISDKLLARMADAYRRIRNTARYLLANLHGFDPAKDMVAPGELLALDRWAVAQAAALQAEIKQAYAESQFHLVYHKLHNYCVVDLGGLYLDILKDRLYTMPAKSLPRRSAQTAMFHIAEAFVRWIAPILSFTADEIWEHLPGDRAQSVFAQTWHAFPALPAAGDGMDWPRLRAAREAVKKVLEDLRVKGQIGSGLDAEVGLYADGALLQALSAPGAELRFWFIVSDARVLPALARPAEAVEAKLENGETLAIRAVATARAKCERCWHRRADIGASAAHPALCGRCVENIEGSCEERRYI
ncbi:MAG: isoleucine--tRNA ligase [Gammaproteobacteria bacterium]|nr:isoleucine--tRNA ligase [Gammaproteobacteria bacterium]